MKGIEPNGLNQIMNGIETPIFAAVALLAFAGSLVALCIFRQLATALKLVDVAGILKRHEGEVPLVGGLAIMAGYSIALIIFPAFFSENAFFLLAGAVVVITGTLDDRYVLDPTSRLVVQIVVALTAVFGGGIVVNDVGSPFFGSVIEMGWLAIPFSILVIVGGINAWNMIDGIDGLASVMAFIGLSCMLIVAGPGMPSVQASLLALLCGIGAFFLFNLPVHSLRRHRTFLGDAGSMFLGLAIVWHAVKLSQGPVAVISPITALWFVALPVFDVLTTTVRRVLNGVSPLSGDRQHLHHLLQDHGMSIRQTLMILSALASTGGVIGLVSHFAGVADGVMFALFGVLGATYFLGVRHLARGVPEDERIAATA